MAAVAELQRQGLVRHIGLSNVTAAQVAEAVDESAETGDRVAVAPVPVLAG